MEWISVKDRLPSDRTLVLVYTCDEEILFGEYRNRGGWSYVNNPDWGMDSTDKIDYWQPLPGPPTSDNSRLTQ